MQQPDTLELATTDAPLVLDRYRLVRRLGSGGFGVVWLAHDERLDRPVAVKRIPLDGDENPRAEREALAAARLAHPGIVALYEAGHDEDAWWLVSELVRGATLADLEHEGALSDLDVVQIGVALCGALEHAHARGVIHRDVKPGNVMVPDHVEDGAGLAKLTDFGIARLADEGALTRTGDVIGTLAYMAPEQAEGGRVTPAVDLYALGLVLYEALGGTNPIRADGAGATARRVGMECPPLHDLRPDLPHELCWAIDAAVDPDPEERGSIADLRRALQAAQPFMDDAPGMVTAPMTPLGGMLERTRRWRAERREDEWRQDPRWAGEEAPLVERARRMEPERGGLRRRTSGPGRIFAALSGGALAYWAIRALPADLTLGGAVAAPEPLAVAAVVAGLVALLPRLGWLMALAALLIVVGPERASLVVLAAAAPVVVLLVLHGPTWSLPGAAPALGAIGLAGAYPALAGQARTLPARAALGAIGFWWLSLVTIITDRKPDLAVVAEPATLALAALWAVAAAVLPLVVRGANAAVDALGAALWAAALAAATPAIAEALDGAEPANTGAAVALGAGFAVAARAVAAMGRE